MAREGGGGREEKKLMEVENGKGAGEGKFTPHTYQTRPYNEAKSVFFSSPLFCSFLGSLPADQSLLSDFIICSIMQRTL